MKALTFQGYQDFTRGRRMCVRGKQDAPVPVLVFSPKDYPCTVLQRRKAKTVSKIFLPDHSRAIVLQNPRWAAKLAEAGSQVLNRLLGYRQVVDTDLASESEDPENQANKDIFVVQDCARGVTVQEALKSKWGERLVKRTLDNPDNLIPFYLHMVLSGDSDRHNENMKVNGQAQLQTYDFEYSGGYDFYTNPGYQSFTTQPVMEERFNQFTPFRAQDFATLKQFIEERQQNQEALRPYYGDKVVEGMVERARILHDTGFLMPTELLFPLIKDTFKAPD